MRARVAMWVVAGLFLPGLLSAQGRFDFGRGGRTPMRVGMPTANGVVDRGFTFCRLYYTSVRSEANGRGWATDYPNADANFATRLSQLTTTGVSRWDDGQPGFTVVDATDPLLFQCPFLFGSDVGTAGFDAAEVAGLRAYLLKGGFLWVDDFWGDRAWSHWAGEIRRVLPELPIQEITVEHSMLQAVFNVADIPQIPSINQWRRMGRMGTSERGAESAVPNVRGIFDRDGRLLVLMTHNTDIADGWEREGEEKEFFDTFSPDAYSFGINVAVWTMAR